MKKIEVFFFANRPLQGFNPLTKVYWKIRANLLRIYSQTNLLSDESILRRIYSLTTYDTNLLRIDSQTNLFSDESNLIRIYSQTNLLSAESILRRSYSLTNLISYESILLLFGSRSYIGSFSSKLPLINKEEMGMMMFLALQVHAHLGPF